MGHIRHFILPIGHMTLGTSYGGRKEYLLAVVWRLTLEEGDAEWRRGAS